MDLHGDQMNQQLSVYLRKHLLMHLSSRYQTLLRHLLSKPTPPTLALAQCSCRIIILYATSVELWKSATKGYQFMRKNCFLSFMQCKLGALTWLITSLSFELIRGASNFSWNRRSQLLFNTCGCPN